MSATFGQHLELLRLHADPVVLQAAGGAAQVALAPLYQGRAMTSTLDGPGGRSLGWIGVEQVARGERVAPMNVWGGEDRFWVGPEGGPHGLYFAAGAPLDFAHWQVPEALDWGAWETLEVRRERASFGREARLSTRSGTRLDVRLERELRLLEPGELALLVGQPLDADVRAVGFQSDNTLTNAGAERWRRERGLPSIWTVGMFPASAACTALVPFRAGPRRELGEALRTDYFGLPGPDRLGVDRRRGLIGLKADGRFRCKLGVPRRRALPWLGAYDADADLLTLVRCDPDPHGDYVDARWRLVEDPYDGDVVNVYNDGPREAGGPSMGAFYELETSSPVRELAPGESLRHVHRTLHLRGPRARLDVVARALLNVGLDEVASAFAE